jgi:hypothetical protein
VSICKDERDNRVLECAKDGDADYIISGDGHLLELESFKKVRILQVNEFLRYYYGT